MAVFHYCANTRYPGGDIETSDGIFETDEPKIDGKWLNVVREGIASKFTQPADPDKVQITSLTRIGG
jgi:hypothetical protein